MLKHLRNAIRKHRRGGPVSALARASEKYLRAWHNEDFYEFSANGERFALEQFRAWKGSRPYHVWDVGAHEGEWAREAKAILGEVTVTSFEIIPAVADGLSAQADPAWHRVNAFGLAEREGTIDVVWNKEHTTTSSIRPRDLSTWFHAETETVRARVRPVDALIAEGTDRPSLVKIDVEGAEAGVLRGAKDLLNSTEGPELIQFEYGQTWIPFGELLRNAYDILTPAGYQVGRLYPDHVVFKPYAYADEHFRMGNYLAARDGDLIGRLAG